MLNVDLCVVAATYFSTSFPLSHPAVRTSTIALVGRNASRVSAPTKSVAGIGGMWRNGGY